MERRALLARVGTLASAGVAATGLSGCAGRFDGSTGTGASPTPTAIPLAKRGYPPEVCAEDPVRLGITPIAEPAFAADWDAVDASDPYRPLTDESAVVGIAREGHARAYPVSVLWVHEIVSERFPDGTPLLVTYCSLCRSGMVAVRRVDGQVTRFGVSGLLWRPPSLFQRASEDGNRTFGVVPGDASGELSTRNTGNLVMYDTATGSYWSQVLARGICGPERGTRLEIPPSTVATWGDWRADNPDTEVLLPPPHSTTGNPPYPGE